MHQLQGIKVFPAASEHWDCYWQSSHVCW